ncbi:hypothetical protein Cni_G01612 [Canna indica]|uniref:GH18 domain-containing protein n=1 Tax=Canna indica TaxID=4628 RepID=A0AAQ3Q166_9LILI|nr:hypothetical protein Cni_G01612 [Canna indica]
MAVALDWINTMCYDFYGSWDTTATSEHATLHNPWSNISTSYGLQSWIAVGVPTVKVAMGMLLFGRTWRLNDRTSMAWGPWEKGGVFIYAKVVGFNRNNSSTMS